MDIVTKHKNSFRIGILLAMSGLLYCGYFQYILIRYIFFPYLIVDSLKYLSKARSRKKDGDEYIKKWICYSTYLIVEGFFDMIFPYTPLYLPYNLSKLFLLYLVIKQPNNYEYFYNLIKKLYDSNRKMIDKYINKLERSFQYYRDVVENMVLMNLNRAWNTLSNVDK